jgi:hypothetical protein
MKCHFVQPTRALSCVVVVVVRQVISGAVPVLVLQARGTGSSHPLLQRALRPRLLMAQAPTAHRVLNQQILCREELDLWKKKSILCESKKFFSVKQII